MIYNQTGEAANGLHVLGTAHFPTHLLTGPHPLLIDAGVACLGPLYVSEIQKVLQKQAPKYLLLTHVHFDHCGAAAYLKQIFPGLQIGVSRKAVEIMQRPRAVQTMTQLNVEVKKWVDKEAPGLSKNVLFEPFQVDLVLSEGDRIDLGNGFKVEVLETPGHTWDSLSYYIPEKKWIFVGEAGGVIGPTGFISTEFAADFNAYMQNLERLSKLDLDLVCQSHIQLFFGKDAKTFFSRSIKAALIFKEKVLTYLDQEAGNVGKVVERIKADEYDSLPDPKQPLSAYLLNLQARVRHLAK